MSDLETVGSRPQAAPISALANGKLQAISAGGARFGQTDQLVDAFAEVFARMAIATPAAVQSEPSDTKDNRETDSDSDASLESSGQELTDKDPEQESVSQANQTAQLTDEKAIPTDPLLSSRETDSETVSITDDVVVNESVKTDQEPTQETETEIFDQQPQGDFAIVDPDAPTVKTETAETVKTGEATVAAAADAESNMSRKRESQGAKNVNTPVEESSVVRTSTTTDSVETSQSDQAQESTDWSADKSAGPQAEGSLKRSKRQQRLDENRENHRIRPSSQANEHRAEARQTTTSAADGSGIESAAAPKPEPSYPQQPVARTANAAFNAIQNAAVRSNATATNPATSESRGTTNAVQPVETNRVDADKRRETSGVKQNATDTAARVKLVQRVSRAFQHLGPEGGMVRLRLAPAELGSVRVEMRVDKNSVLARVVTETEAASATLREHLPDLRARLESLGMQVEQIEVETEADSDQTGLPFDREPQQRQDQRQPRNRDKLDQSQQDQTAAESNSVAVMTQTLQPSLASHGVDLKL